jgi:hypothetical protein
MPAAGWVVVIIGVNLVIWLLVSSLGAIFQATAVQSVPMSSVRSSWLSSGSRASYQMR